MSIKAIAIFDIGKSNKKFTLFDFSLRILDQECIAFEETEDDDGYPCDDLDGILRWIENTINKHVKSNTIDLSAINFTTYGASLVHLGDDGKRTTPFYNYLKPINPELQKDLTSPYGGELAFASDTSSPMMGMLNSGMQLYFLKLQKPDLFALISKSVHFPQYLSYLYTGHLLSEYTSVGCHTAMWNMLKQEYHQWIKDHELNDLLPPVFNSTESFKADIYDKEIQVGIGIHDSSAALLPYLMIEEKPFILLSTGTWSITVNPFNHAHLSTIDLKKDCLAFLSTDGEPVRASRLFLGKEFKFQVEKIAEYFNCKPAFHQDLAFDAKKCVNVNAKPVHKFKMEFMNAKLHGYETPESTDLSQFESAEIAYYQLMHELTDMQISSIRLALGATSVDKLFIDGGFSKNDFFVQLLANKLPHLEIVTAEAGMGTTLGAALALKACHVDKDDLAKQFNLRVIHPRKI